MKFALFILSVFLFFLQISNVFACSVIYDSNHPRTEVLFSSIIIKTNSADVYTTFESNDYLMIYQDFMNSCGPYQTYIRKDFLFSSLALVSIITVLVFIILNRKNRNILIKKI